jgi:Mlc titration factor MtfA (ptsG expression regulator)
LPDICRFAMSDSTKTIILSNPDSIEYYLDSLPPDIRAVVEKEIQPLIKKPDDNSLMYPSFFILGTIAFIAYHRIKKIRLKKANEAFVLNTYNTQRDYFYYQGAHLGLTENDITIILEKYCTYYTCLSEKLQLTFVERVKQFMSTKTFRLPKDATFKEMPVLFSPAATQLTFGIGEYTFSWFENINVNAEEYFADYTHSLRLLAGNVGDKSISIAWNHFLNGISNQTDGSNVGLHELAHALYYQYTVIEKKKDFTGRFDAVMNEIEGIYRSGKDQQPLFSDYAFRNTQEFWAESIEIFFERPAGMLNEFPGLFNSIEILLNQNPLNKANPVI